jgi:hypothetical protein
MLLAISFGPLIILAVGSVIVFLGKRAAQHQLEEADQQRKARWR